MAINIGNPAERRDDLVAALKELLEPEWGSFEEAAAAVVAALGSASQQEPVIVTAGAWGAALAPADRWREFWFSGATAITLPNNLALPLDYKVGLRRLGPAPTIAVAAGAVLAPAITTIVGQYLSASATVVAKTETSLTWVVEGAVG